MNQVIIPRSVTIQVNKAAKTRSLTLEKLKTICNNNGLRVADFLDAREKADNEGFEYWQLRIGATAAADVLLQLSTLKKWEQVVYRMVIQRDKIHPAKVLDDDYAE
jgi:hypothetical protein